MEAADIVGGTCPILEPSYLSDLIQRAEEGFDGARLQPSAHIAAMGAEKVVTCRVEAPGTTPDSTGTIWNEPALVVLAGGPTDRFDEPQEIRELSETDLDRFPFVFVPLPEGGFDVYAWETAFVGVAWSARLPSVDSREIAEHVFARAARD